MKQAAMTTGRIGYVHVCKDGETREPEKIEVYEYETNLQPVRLSC